MADHNIFDEIQADLEREKLEKMWKRYAPLVAALAIAVIAGTAGSSAYHAWKTNRDQHVTGAYLDAVKQDPDVNKNIASLQKFATDHAGSNQADFALLRAGALASEQNDLPKAVQFFDTVAHNAKADLAFRQLGDLLSVQAQMDMLDKGGVDAAALSARLEPLAQENAPWQFSALEDQGYLALSTGDTAKAKQIFTTLSQDARVQPSIAERAADILRSLN